VSINNFITNKKRSYKIQDENPKKLQVASRFFNEVDCSLSFYPKGNI